MSPNRTRAVTGPSKLSNGSSATTKSVSSGSSGSSAGNGNSVDAYEENEKLRKWAQKKQQLNIHTEGGTVCCNCWLSVVRCLFSEVVVVVVVVVVVDGDANVIYCVDYKQLVNEREIDQRMKQIELERKEKGNRSDITVTF